MWFPDLADDIAEYTLPSATAAATGSFLTWRKPAGCRFIFIICIGAGGGGAGGASGAASSARGGGGGGGSGAYSTAIVPAAWLPDELFVQVGIGGPAGAADADGTAGNRTLVTVRGGAFGGGESVCVGLGGSGGSKGTATTGGAGGAAGTAISSDASMVYGSFGITKWSPGIIGAAGGAQTGVAGTGVTPLSGLTCAGAGGGGVTGTDTAGGGYLSSGLVIGNSGGAAAGGAGPVGFKLDTPRVYIGGSGGGSNNSGTGGAGGYGGAPGCGGGGGGAGQTGGAGGAGADGYAAIGWW